MILDDGLSWIVVYDFRFRNYVEGLGVHHEVTNSFTGVSDLNHYAPKEQIAVISPNDCNRFMPGRAPWKILIIGSGCLLLCVKIS